MGFTTKALHTKPAHEDIYGAMRFPMYQSAAFEFGSAEVLEAVFKGEKVRHVYAEYSYTQKALYTLNDGMVRVSVGIEDIDEALKGVA